MQDLPTGHTLTRDDAMALIAKMAEAADTDFGLEEVMDGLLEVIASASPRLSMLEMSWLLGSAGIICRLATQNAVAAGDPLFGNGIKH